MQRNKFILVLLVVFLATFVAASFPGIPHQFYGKVIINGNSHTSGVISAEINGEEVAIGEFEDGEYGYDPLFLIEDPENNFDGKLITFYINGVVAKTYTFKNGAVTKLGICITLSSFCGNDILEPGEECDDGNVVSGDGCSSICLIESPQEPVCGNGVKEGSEECDDGNNINGDGCSSTCKIEEDEECEKCCCDNDNKKEELVFSCEPNWECSGWSECLDGIMMRKCKDTNNCGFSYNKPSEITGCQEALSTPVFLDSQGKTNEVPLAVWILFVVFAILIIVAIVIILVNTL